MSDEPYRTRHVRPRRLFELEAVSAAAAHLEPN